MFQRPDIQTQPPGAGLDSGTGYDMNGNVGPPRR
jgi:hypothetical protein